VQKYFTPNGSSSLKDTVESKQGFWSALAKKAKSALLEDGSPVQYPESQARNGSHVQQARAHIQVGTVVQVVLFINFMEVILLL
jgi:hypothetical protein